MQQPHHVPKKPMHSLTIDVEDYYQVSAFENNISRHRWDDHECRVDANTRRILSILADHDTRATFFTLGWVAKRHPTLVRDLAEAGHEIASHGFNHQRLNHLSQRQFREDIRAAKTLLEDITGQPVLGYRAPSFSFDETRPWIQDELLSAGHSYSSSINPVPHDLYGYRNAPRTPFCWDNELLEIPVATCQIGGRRIPCAGGGYFRLYPYALSRRLLQQATVQLQGPAVFYLHPWELDPGQPRIPGASLKSRFRHYVNLGRTQSRLSQLLKDFDWCPMRDLDVIRDHQPGIASSVPKPVNPGG